MRAFGDLAKTRARSPGESLRDIRILWPGIIEFPSIFLSIDSISRDTLELERNRIFSPAEGETTKAAGSTVADSAVCQEGVCEKERRGLGKERSREDEGKEPAAGQKIFTE